MQKIIVIGNLGDAPETRQGKGDKEFYTAKIAVNHYKNSENQTVWYSLVFGDSFAKRIAVMSKGQKLYIEGEPDVNTYDKKDGGGVGIDRKIFVKHVEIISKIEKSEEAPAASSKSKGKGKSADIPVDEDDDLPF